MKPTDKFAYSFDPERFYSDGFDSVEEALKAAKAEYDSDPCYIVFDTVYIGRVYKFEPIVSSTLVVEDLQNDAYDEVGEASEDYLEHISKDDWKKLCKMLTETFNKWAAETSNEPAFFTVEEVEEYSLEDSDHEH